MKKFSLKRAMAFSLATLCGITVTACAKKEVEKELLPVEGSSIASGDELYKEFDIRKYTYDESGLFSKSLSEYDFNYFPEVYRTDINLNSVLDAYGISYEDYTKTFVRIIYSCRGADNYEDAYALTSSILNRLSNCYSSWGNSILNIVTAPNQYPTYGDGTYQNFKIEELENYAGWQAIIDCLINFAEDQTNRMHDCQSFRYEEYTTYNSDDKVSPNGNKYIDPLQEDQIAYVNIDLNRSETLN